MKGHGLQYTDLPASETIGRDHRALSSVIGRGSCASPLTRIHLSKAPDIYSVKPLCAAIFNGIVAALIYLCKRVEWLRLVLPSVRRDWNEVC